MTSDDRRYDIDWVRVIAIGLLLVYHIGIAFQPWGVFIGFIQSDKPLTSLWIPMSMLNIWRIPLLFFVSGMGVCFAIRKRNWKQLVLERAQRIFLPFLFGIFCIVPLHLFVWQKYYSQDIVYKVDPSHLWFLANIFIYVLMLTPLFFYLRNKVGGGIQEKIKKLFSTPPGLLVVIAAFIAEAVIARPETYESYAMTWHGFFLGLLAFLFGFLFIYSNESFWETVLKCRWSLLGSALALYLVRWLVFDLVYPLWLMPVESCLWIFSVFGFAHKYLNRGSKTLSYLSQAAYPVYIIHMVVLYLGTFLIIPMDLSGGAKLLLVVAFTGIGCMGIYEFIIRRVGILRPLFGLRIECKNQ